MARSWRRVVFRCLVVYLAVGLSMSFAQNLYGAVTGGLTAFAWTGSLKHNAILFLWWFIVPAIIWPYELYWTLYWKVFG
jgi:hypothetical protein